MRAPHPLPLVLADPEGRLRGVAVGEAHSFLARGLPPRDRPLLLRALPVLHASAQLPRRVVRDLALRLVIVAVEGRHEVLSNGEHDGGPGKRGHVGQALQIVVSQKCGALGIILKLR